MNPSAEPRKFIHNPYPLNFLPRDLDIKSTTFSDAAIITYEIELPASGKKNCFNLLDDDDFTIPYIIDIIMNPLAGHKLPTQDNNNVLIISINGEEPIT